MYGDFQKYLEALFHNDSVGKQLVAEAITQFRESRLSRSQIRRIRKRARAQAELFLNCFLEGKLTQDEIEEIIRNKLSLNFEHPIRGASKELIEAYHYLGIITDYSAKAIEIPYPQAAMDPYATRFHDASTLSALEGSAALSPIISCVEAGQKEIGDDPDTMRRKMASQYARLSKPLFMPFQGISSTKVYWTGPVFYENASRSWSLTFSTGSGLPDPLEWHGSTWFCSRYGVSSTSLDAHGVGSKNPFREVNFSLGIANPALNGKRIYVWQRSKTQSQLKCAYRIAYDAGAGRHFLKDALNQLTHVFKTRNLKIIQLETFPDSLSIWTRVSPRNVMLSSRAGTLHKRIDHALWFTPGFTLSDEVLTAVSMTAPSFLGLMTRTAFPQLSQNELVQLLALTAGASMIYLSLKSRNNIMRKYAQEVHRVMADIDNYVDVLWRTERLPGVVKERNAYKGNARDMAVDVLSGLLEVDRGTLLAVDAGVEEPFGPECIHSATSRRENAPIPNG